MKHTRKIILSFLAVFILSAFAVSASAIHEPTEEYYVADHAQVLSPDLESKIISTNDMLYEQTGAQIVVASVRYLEDGYYADEYAVKLFDEWGVGSFSDNNGILILLVTEEGKAWVTQGSGIKHQLSNDDINELLEDHFWKAFDKGDYDKAVEKLFDELIDWYEDYYNVTLGETAGSTAALPAEPASSPTSGGKAIRLVFKGILVVAVFMAMSSLGSLLARKTAARTMNRSYRSHRSTRSNTYYRPPVRPSGTFHGNSRPNRSNTRGGGGASFRGSSGSSRSSHSTRTGGGGRSGGGGAGRR